MKALASIFLLNLILPSLAFSVIGGQPVLMDDKLEKMTLLLVAQQPDNQYFAHCSAVPLSKRVLLTAAHCFDTHSRDLFVKRAHEDSLSRKIKDWRVLPGWPADDLADIAIAVLDGDLPDDTIFSEIDFEAISIKKSSVIISGFGKTSGRMGAKDDEGILRQAKAPILAKLKDGQGYSINQYEGLGICHGDSGGPIFIKNPDEKFFLVGISHSVAGVPLGSEMDFNSCIGIGKYSSVQYFKDWIQSSHLELLKLHDLQLNP